MFSGAFFEALMHVPQEIAPTVPYGYILPGNILPLWMAIEDSLDKVVANLCTFNQLRPKLPLPPRQFGYSKIHETEGEALVATVDSRDWFSLWFGLLYWAMSKTQVENPGDEVDTGNGPPKWFTQLVGIHCNQALLDNLLTEPLLQKNSTTDRIGVILHFPDGRHHLQQPPAAWFISSGIPVWYRWGAQEAEAAETLPNFSLPGPPTHQLQEATMLLGPGRHFLHPETQPSQVGVLGSDSTDPPTQDHSAKAVLEAFFRKRAARKRARLRRRQENVEEGEVIEDILSKPGSVFVWDWDPQDPTLFMRMHIPWGEGEETLAKYASYQKRYDASCNEWDCCRLWDPEDENIWNEAEKNNQHRSTRDQGPPNLDTQAELNSHAVQTPAAHVDTVSDGIAETKIFDLLRLHYGFVSPLPFPETFTMNPSLNSPRNQDLLKNALGLVSIPPGSSLLQKPHFRFYTQFMHKFTAVQPQKPNDDEWDLSSSNRLTLASCSRLRNVRLVTGKYDLSLRMYMFDFGSEATVPWKLAVYSSATVLYICRLREDMRDQDIALALVQSGFPFRTFQPVDMFLDVLEMGPSSDPALLPIRVRGDSFSLSDWHKYEAQQRLILAQPRCGRAALRRAGFVWRVARDVVDMGDVLAGPSGRYTNSDLNFSVLDDQGIEYIDDDLTASELDVLSGSYLNSTGMWLKY